MPLFQQPARTPDEVARSRPLDIAPAEVADMDEATWYARVFRGDDVPQLTVRAVVMGSLLGFLLAFTNLYIGLKTGWGLGVAITACILSFTIWTALLKAGLARTPMSILENNCMQSTASAAGYATGSSMITATPALLMLTATPQNPGGTQLPWPVLAGWTLCLGVLGTALAIPMKRSLINRERLRFPSGVAAAVTLHSLYSHGASAMKKAWAMLAGALPAALMPVLMDLHLRAGPTGRQPLLPGESAVFNWLPMRGAVAQTGAPATAADFTMVLDHRLAMVAAGMITGLRVSVWLVVGGLGLVFFVAPAAVAAGAAHSPGSAWREVGVWVGAPMMVSSGLLWFALQWQTVARTVRGLFRRGTDDQNRARPGVEVPASWFITGTGVGGIGVALMGHMFFGIPWPMGLLAVALTFFLSLVAARATGETDINPAGAMGQLVQLTYGALIPQNATANLMSASITANAAVSAADLLNDLKSGYLLGAHPRRQYVAQFLGIFAGTAGTVGGYYLLVPDASVLVGSGATPAAFPAPAAQAWLTVARVFQDGFDNLHPMDRQAMLWGLSIGAVLAVAEVLLPRWKKWLPSATGLAFGMMLPFSNPLSFLIGAVAAEIWSRRSRATAEDYVVPVASGAIAGESLIGVAVATLNNFVLK